MKLTVLIVEAEKAPYATQIENSLNSMQKIVDGLIEPIFLNDNVAIIVNEEGKLRGLAPNRFIYNEYFQDIICGTFFLCLAPTDSEDFKSLPPDLLEIYSKKFSHLQVKL